MLIGVHSAKFSTEKLSQNIQAAARRHQIDYPIVNDASLKIWSSYAVRAWPTLILVDPRGKIAYEVSGEVLADELVPQIERLIEEFDQAGLLDRSPLPGLQPEPPPDNELLYFPAKLAAAGDLLYIADSGHHRILETGLNPERSQAEIRRVFGTGQAGLQDGPPDTARFNRPHGLALAGGLLFVADTENHALRAIDLQTGLVETLAGTGEKGHGRLRHGPPTETPLRSPWDVLALGPDTPGAYPLVFVAMAGSHQIWLRLEDGRLGVFAGSGQEALHDGPLAEACFNQPSGLAFGMSHLFVADPEASAIRAISLGSQELAALVVDDGHPRARRRPVRVRRVADLPALGLESIADRRAPLRVELPHDGSHQFGDSCVRTSASAALRARSNSIPWRRRGSARFRSVSAPTRSSKRARASPRCARRPGSSG